MAKVPVVAAQLEAVVNWQSLNTQANNCYFGLVLMEMTAACEEEGDA